MRSPDYKKIIVTGGAGYIGSHVVLELLLTGKFQPIVLDNGHNSKPKLCLERVQELADGEAKKSGLSMPRILMHDIDLRSRQAIDDIFERYAEEGGIWGVIHLAAWKAVGESGQLPMEYYENNVAAVLNLLGSMKSNGVPNFVYSSSATVYGEPKVIPIPETSALQPASCYGRTKVMCEQILMDLAKADEFWKICSLRYFNPAGAHPSGRIGEDPQGKPNNLLPLLSAIAVGRFSDLQVFGDDFPTPDGTCLRDYLHITDLAKGHIKAVEAVIEGRIFQKSQVGNHRAFNLGTGTAYSVLEMVEAMREATGFQYKYNIVGRRDGDVPNLTADPSLANRDLGWKAEQNLQSMCADLWRWQSNNLAGY